MKTIRVLLLAMFLMVMTGCAELEPAATPTEELPALVFSPKITMYEAGKIHLEIGIANQSGKEQVMIEDISIRAVITDEAGQLQNQLDLVDLGPIQANETAIPLIFEGLYIEGNYVISLTGKDIASFSLPFEIVVRGGLDRLSAPSEYIDPATEFTIEAPGT
jgi:hypothetical protein